MAPRAQTEKEIKRRISIEQKERKYLKRLYKLVYGAEHIVRPLAYEHTLTHHPIILMKGKQAYKIILDTRNLLFKTLEYIKKAFEEEKKLGDVAYHGDILNNLARINRHAALAFRICERLLLRKSPEPQRDITTTNRLLMVASNDAKIALATDERRINIAIEAAIEAQKKKLKAEKQKLERPAA